MPRRQRGPALFSFGSIRDAVFVQHDFEISPLWEWLKDQGCLATGATPTSDIVSSKWGIYSQIKPPGAGDRESKEHRRRRGAWQAVERCFRDVVARSPEASFLVEFARVVSAARGDLRALTKKIDAGAKLYLKSLHSYLRALAARLGRANGHLLKLIELPGPETLTEMAAPFRTADQVLSRLHADLTRPVASPVAVALGVKRGNPERVLLKEIELTLHDAGFRDREIAELILDLRSPITAIDRVKERRRSGRRTRRRRAAPKVGQ